MWMMGLNYFKNIYKMETILYEKGDIFSDSPDNYYIILSQIFNINYKCNNKFYNNI